MKLWLICLLVLVIAPGTYKGQTDRFKPPDPVRIAALERELATAGQDTAQLRLRYLIGLEKKIYRFTYWDSLLAEARKIRSLRFEGLFLGQIGMLYIRKRDEKGLEYFTKSSAILEKEGYSTDLIPQLLRLTWFYQVKDKIPLALDYCYKALKIAEEHRNKKYLADIYQSIGACYFITGDYNRALAMHFRCMSAYKAAGNDPGVADALTDIGADYLALKDTARSIDYYLKSKRYLPCVRNDLRESGLLCAVGGAYELQGQLDSSFAYFYKAYNLELSKGEKRVLISPMSSLSRISLLKGDTKKAKELALDAFKLIKNEEFSLQMPALAKILMDIHLKEKNYKAALEAHMLYVSSRDSLSNEDLRRKAREQEFNYNLAAKENRNQLLAQENRMQAFVLAGLVTVLLLVLLIAYLVLRQNRLRASQQNEQLEQKLLRSQMNPHFIFNSLQAIQNYISERGGKGAIDYLGAFARVMRNVLENSRTELVPLKQELELLRHYLHLQKLRFGERFNYAIDIDEALQEEDLAIPPMLLQPFIENAIEHGMHNVKSGGLVHIAYRLQNGRLLVEISDNGYGMQPGRNEEDHRSFAMEITRERIALLNKKEKKKISFLITDAFPGEPERKGVKVNFNLPIIPA